MTDLDQKANVWGLGLGVILGQNRKIWGHMMMTVRMIVTFQILGLLEVSEVIRDVGHDRVVPGGFQSRL